MSSDKCIQVDQLVSSLAPSDGGPSRTVIQLSEALSKEDDVKVRIVTQSISGKALIKPQSPLVDIVVGNSKSKLRLALGLPGRSVLSEAIHFKKPDLLHINGIWTPLTHWATRLAHQKKVPTIIQPRGMLEPWALNHRALKKRFALWLYQRGDLDRASMLIATAEQEAENFRELGFKNPIAIIPNGIEFNGQITNRLRNKKKGSSEIKIALSLGRIHPKKGLINLLQAWSLIYPDKWILQIAGPDEEGHLSELLAISKKLGIENKVHFLGEVDDRKKWGLYEMADLFVLPSFSENFGVVVAEALASGLPVISTTGTPWQDLVTYNCGWWVKPTLDDLKGALSAAFALDSSKLKEIGINGIKYVQRYDWGKISQNTILAYRWVLGLEERPACVQVG